MVIQLVKPLRGATRLIRAVYRQQLSVLMVEIHVFCGTGTLAGGCFF
jgi:hypothetical protein